MISKIFRLTRNDIGKVLKYKKPFFSSVLVANVIATKLAHPRFAIILSGKVARTSVDRNTFRRAIYDICQDFLHIPQGFDVAFVFKKGVIVSRKDEAQILLIERESRELLEKIVRESSKLPPPKSFSR